MLVGAAGDTLALIGGQVDRSAQGGGADEDLSRFLGHEQGA